MILTYRNLLNMLTKSNDRYDDFWDLGLFEQAIKYNKISIRIIKAMEKYDTNLMKINL